MNRPKIDIVMGTRPEAIKLAPVVAALRQKPAAFQVRVLSTGQHREMLAQVLEAFDLAPDLDLSLMQPGQSLPDITARVLTAMDGVLAQKPPDLLMVQGDTTTVFAAGLAAFYRGIPVAHVEAGLRSHDMANPFPEEANRRLVGVLTRLHFAPTALAAGELLAENVEPARILVTGNTVVDALNHISNRIAGPLSVGGEDLEARLQGRRLILVTTHRRESWGHDMEGVCLAVRRIVEIHPDVVAVLPVHLNPRVSEVVTATLGDHERIRLLPPLPYTDFIRVMKRACLILTDSGGVQEEAPAFGIPVLILRKVTERPEAVQHHLSLVVGTDPQVIIRNAAEVLSQRSSIGAVHPDSNPYGDGRAAQRIRLAMERYFQGSGELLSPEESFRPTAEPLE
jgi:UDP-N-acetylglucosamine 2-epimerase (non-hydrolysing)